MEEKTISGIGFLLIIAIIWLGVTVHNQNKQIEQLKGVISDCDSAVTDANNNISDANDQINSAKNEAWSDYDSMGNALDGLQEGEQVDNPCYLPLN